MPQSASARSHEQASMIRPNRPHAYMHFGIFCDTFPSNTHHRSTKLQQQLSGVLHAGATYAKQFWKHVNFFFFQHIVPLDYCDCSQYWPAGCKGDCVKRSGNLCTQTYKVQVVTKNRKLHVIGVMTGVFLNKAAQGCSPTVQVACTNVHLEVIGLPGEGISYDCTS